MTSEKLPPSVNASYTGHLYGLRPSSVRGRMGARYYMKCELMQLLQCNDVRGGDAEHTL